ncbi:MAG: hypothetical protein WC557_00780 [Ignavibacteriaceae bacterium]
MEIIPIAIGTNNLKFKPFIHSTSFMFGTIPTKSGQVFLSQKIFYPF